MKYVYSLILPLLIAFFGISYEIAAHENKPTSPLICMRQQVINKKASEIEAKIKRDYYIRMGLIGVVVARMGYLAWDRCLRSYVFPTPEELLKKVLAEKALKELAQAQKELKQLEIVKEQQASENITQEQVLNPKLPKITWHEWAQHNLTKEQIGTALKNKTIALSRFIAATGFQTGMGLVMQGVYSRLNYPNTLRWYVCTQVSYVRVIENIKETMLLLQDTSLDVEHITQNRQLLQDLCYLLVLDGEKIAGYMTYKTKQLDVERKMLAERAVYHFITFYNSSLKRIHELVGVETNYNALISEIDAFAQELKRYLRHFAVVEGETDEERYVVGEMSQQSLMVGLVASLF